MNIAGSEMPHLSGIHKEILAFVGITFILTYAFDLWLIVTFGDISKVPPYSTLVQMLIPAAVAIFCACFFRDRTLTPASKVFFAVFAVNAAVFLWEMTIGPIIPATLVTLPIYRFMPTLSIIVSVASVFILIGINLVKRSREELYPAGLSFGRNLKWYAIIPGLFTVLFFAAYYLNHTFGFGDPFIEYSLEAFWAGLAVNLLIGFCVGWYFYFGEEYGWRVYLQDRLFTVLGGRKGVLLLGVVWGLWHSGLILMGMNYPGQPVLGNAVMILLAVVMGVFYSIAVLKTGSVWIAVLLHLITDTMEPLAWLYLSYPADMISSFGTGIYGIAIMGIAAVLLLRLDIWDQVRLLISERQSAESVPDQKPVGPVREEPSEPAP
ncbi:CPBP family intramembrane metalloprotease [Methanoculleus sp. FWC-SCC1]|uniref:CPBP family intramembrane metalloprotease n=1 Tax=Methanoculleus frigidifontis TaxID=2584085 RepID=A0ABT8M8U5_9EURY|nr:type II CAAX endopeptidase family protein [Methanoculleus sp. FWC-SCC1]MDN7024334.1 CPBP family intramembrane metalloprotease [Methanoculleus sp. FWC-SCC1]